MYVRRIVDPLRRNGISRTGLRKVDYIMPIQSTAWYRHRYEIGLSEGVKFKVFDPLDIIWPFGTSGLSVLRTRVAALLWWVVDSPSPQPGPAFDVDAMGVQVQFTEPILGDPAWVPSINDAGLDERFKPTVNATAQFIQTVVTAYDGSADLPFQWTTYAGFTTESADSHAQRHFDSGTTINEWVSIGPINDWVADLVTTPTFGAWVTVDALIGSHT